jgi:glycine/D-amino acid oxidase-like deaminating enzyme
MKDKFDVIVIGAGIFGITAVLELQRRGYETAVLDPGPLPHPLAASTDISKVIRMEYGADETYMAMVETSLAGWQQWNEGWREPLYHECGVIMLTQEPMTSGGFEHESYQLLLKRGHKPERLNTDEIRRRFPAWNADLYVDGFFHAKAGYAESGRVVTALLQQAKQAGTAVHPNQTVSEIIVKDGRVTGLRTQEGETFHTPHVLVAAGTWTHLLVPDLAPFMRSVGQPVFHLQLDAKTAPRGSPPNFVVCAAGLNNTGG